MPELLIELFSEEIPARMQKRASEDLKKLVTDGLVEAGLTYVSAAAFSTPRRLTLVVEELLAHSPAVKEERKGPRVDAPEKALEGFLRSTGLTKDALEQRPEKKGPVYFAVIERPGRAAEEIIAEVLEAAIRNFPWPKSMRWGAGTLKWVRPLHRILCVLSDEAGARHVPMTVDGIEAADVTEGHRFHAPKPFSIVNFEDYTRKLKQNYVVLDPAERAEAIWHEATNMAFANGLEVVEDKSLLAEVAGLVEWPVVLMGEIGADFLELPAEVLQTSMREHQKFFSVRDAKSGKILRFVTVANRETADTGATILAGNQKVLSARLSDAKFFWENDLRVAQVGMEQWLERLEAVTFHNKLGSEAARISRIANLSESLASYVGADPVLAGQAARVAKADLASEMVYEFPELQGVMGQYYASAAGLPEPVAAACAEHYSPLGPSDDVPNAPVSVAVSMAEKIDKLTGFWAIDEKPTGSKDPFALRRAALGVIRLVLENNLRLNLREVFAKAFAAFETEKVEDQIADDLLGFIHDRLKVYLRDEGLRHDVIDACLAMPGDDDLALLVARVRALQAFLQIEDGENLLQGFKRANNILNQAESADGVAYEYGADRKFVEVAEETALFDVLETAEPAIAEALKVEDFAAAMEKMANMRAPIDAFFETVQVNSENSIVRRNRLNLLSSVRKICLSVADLTRVEG